MIDIYEDFIRGVILLANEDYNPLTIAKYAYEFSLDHKITNQELEYVIGYIAGMNASPEFELTKEELFDFLDNNIKYKEYWIQKSIVELIKLGSLPSEQAPDIELIKQYQDLLERIKMPISDDEAIALSVVFGNDDCFGLAWTLLHIIETAPSWPIKEALKNTDNEWIKTLVARSL